MPRISLALLSACALLSSAYAHDEAQWIQDGDYHNALGQLCCGPKDCRALADGDVVPSRNGYLIRSRKETVPFDQVTPLSPDGRYWMCVWGGERKCFFAPPPGS